MLEKLRRSFFLRLWNFSLERGRKGRFFFKMVRVLILAVKEYRENQCSWRASSLTYYTVMSIVPILAIVFALTRWIGIHERAQQEILDYFPEQNVVFTELFKYADNLFNQTKEKGIATFGVILLGLSIYFLIGNLEKIVNSIWKVQEKKKWVRMVLDSLVLILFTPIFFLIANSISVFLVEQIEMVIRQLPLSKGAIGWLSFFIEFLPYCLFWFFFTFLYFFIPHKRVFIQSALFGGVIMGTIYLLVQWGYLYFQMGVSRYGSIYGSIAAVPLFLVWLQLSWCLFLFGATLSHAYQTVDKYIINQGPKIGG